MIKDNDISKFKVKVGQKIVLNEILYKVTYVRNNPYRFTAEYVGKHIKPEPVVEQPSKIIRVN